MHNFNSSPGTSSGDIKKDCIDAERIALVVLMFEVLASRRRGGSAAPILDVKPNPKGRQNCRRRRSDELGTMFLTLFFLSHGDQRKP